MGTDDDSAGLLGEFGTWLDRERGLSPESVRCYSNLAKAFLALAGGPGAVGGLDAGQVTAFMVGHSQGRNTWSAKAMVTSLRAFLRFAHATHSRSGQLIGSWPALAVARSMAGMAGCAATPAVAASMRWPRTGTAAGGKIASGCPGWPVIAARTVGKTSRCWFMPVADRTLATSGDGAARRRDPPSSRARCPLLTRTARPLASACSTADRSMIRWLAARSRLRSCSRRAGADAMPRSPLSAAMA